MTALGIASRLVAKHGHPFATGYVRGRYDWHVSRLWRGIGTTAHGGARVIFWASVSLALGRLS